MLYSLFALLELLIILSLPAVLIFWFVFSLVKVILKYRRNEKPSEEQVASLLISSIVFACLVAFLIYIISVFANGMYFM